MPERRPRFAAIHLENWRNFVRVDVALQGRVFLVGPNASGKSNLLDVFRFLHDIVSAGGGLQAAVAGRGGVARLRCLDARRVSHVIIRVKLAGTRRDLFWGYDLRFTNDPHQRPIIVRERVLRDGEELIARPDLADEEDPERLTQTSLEQAAVNGEFREIADLFRQVRYQHLVPQIIREPERSAGRRDDPHGGDFLARLASTPGPARHARLRRIRDALRVVVPRLRDLELARDASGTPHLRGNYEHWRPAGAWQTEAEFSDGTLRLIGLLWSALDGAGPLLLEEPEQSLHPDVVRFIPEMFARIQRRTGGQILLTTHSTEMIEDGGIGLDELLLLVPGREGTAVRPAARIAEVKALLAGGSRLAGAAPSPARPKKARQLPLFGE